MLHRIFVKEGAAPELLRCIAARMHYPYLGQNKFEILTYRPRITKYAALLFPVSVQYPNTILCICHENGTELTFQAGRVLSVAKMLLTNAINNGLRLTTVLGESDAQKYGYTIRNCIRCFPGANKTAYVFRIAIHTATRKDCQCREGDTSVVTVYSDGRIVADD